MAQMTSEHVFFALIAVIIIREIWYTYTINKLVNKLMCKSLHEYNLAESVYVPRKADEEIDFDDERSREDLGALSSIV